MSTSMESASKAGRAREIIEVPYWDPAGRSEGRLRAWMGRRRA